MSTTHAIQTAITDATVVADQASLTYTVRSASQDNG